MLRTHIIKRCCDALKGGKEKREKANKQKDWSLRKKEIVEAVKNALGDMPFGKNGHPLNTRLVSRIERENYILENVAFESLPGYETNASVYLPKAIPQPWPAIIVPVGHSGKQFENYQIPAQVFAQCGYVAVTFDPPGHSGEKNKGNNHFDDGVRCYLTGHSSNRYFVIDALRAIDYLETRDDIAMENGVAITGQSGGGHTAVFGALLDDRIKVVAPTCIMTQDQEHPVKDAYGLCPEPYFANRFGFGIADADLLCALAPTPLLMMAGKEDEIFRGDWTKELYEKVKQTYKALEHEDKLSLFMDDCGHKYTVKMALELVDFLNEFLEKKPNKKRPSITRKNCEMLPCEMLKCYPRTDKNIYSINKELALNLEAQRIKGGISEKLKAVVVGIEDAKISKAVEGAPFRAFTHNFQELLLATDEDIELPATFISPYDKKKALPAILFLDDQGRGQMLENGILGRLIDLANKDSVFKAALLTVDLRGWGDTKPCLTPFDAASWASPERWIGYVSTALGDHVLAMRVRDALASFYYLQNRPEIDESQIIVAGRGMGAVVALHVAAASRCDGLATSPPAAGVACLEMLSSFMSLCESESCQWSHDAFLPNILLHYDIPQLIDWLENMPSLIVDPLGAEKQTLTLSQAKEIFKRECNNFTILTGENKPYSYSQMQNWTKKILNK